MKIRCKNCYRVLNPNEEYCTSCGEHSEQMLKAMVTGNYGPDQTGKCKLGLGLFASAGFIVCGILNVIFATMQAKELEFYTTLFCQSNSLFYSSILVAILTVIFFIKDLRNIVISKSWMKWLVASVIGILGIVVSILLSMLFDVTQIMPLEFKNYLASGNAVLFDLQGECIIKIVVGCILSSVALEFICRKLLVDALDETMLGEKAIFIITTIVVTLCEVAWNMSLHIVIVALLINIINTAIYMYADRNILLNIIIRILLVVMTVVVFLV